MRNKHRPGIPAEAVTPTMVANVEVLSTKIALFVNPMGSCQAG